MATAPSDPNAWWQMISGGQQPSVSPFNDMMQSGGLPGVTGGLANWLANPRQPGQSSAAQMPAPTPYTPPAPTPAASTGPSLHQMQDDYIKRFGIPTNPDNGQMLFDPLITKSGKMLNRLWDPREFPINGNTATPYQYSGGGS